MEPHFLLVNQLIALAAEARQADAIAVTLLGYDLVNIKLWFQIILHNRNYFFKGYYSAGVIVDGLASRRVQPS